MQEESLALYAVADLKFDISVVPVSINAGARYIDTTVTSSGYHQIQNSDGSTGYTDAPVSSEGDYQKLLPAFNLNADLIDSIVLRAAASQTLIRPALTDLANIRTASFNSFRFTDGNPALEPTYADQWEVGLEKNFDNGGILAASYFWKQIEGVIQNELTGVVPNVTKYNADGSVDGVYDFDVYQQVNADGSYDVTFYYEDEYVEAIERSMYPVYRDSYGQTDFSASYSLNDQFQLELQGINLTDEETSGYTMNPSFPTMYELSGRRISFGLRAEF